MGVFAWFLLGEGAAHHLFELGQSPQEAEASAWPALLLNLNLNHAEVEIRNQKRNRNKMSMHKFKLGQSVFLQPTLLNRDQLPGSYAVTMQLPIEGDGRLRYRIKNSSEPYERVVMESDLSSE